MDDRTRVALVFVASQLVFVSAVLHIGHGGMEWLRRAQYGVFVPYQFRFPMLVFAGVAVIAGMAVAWRSERERVWYLVGFVAMLGSVMIYYGHHLAGHRRYVLFGEQFLPPEPVSVQFFVDHFFAGTFETLTLTAELMAALLLAILYVATGEE